MAQDDQLRELVAEVAAAYFSNSHVTPGEIPIVVERIAASLGAVGAAQEQAAAEVKEPEPEAPAIKKLTPAQIRKSVTPEALISFEDGKPYKTLKRHLGTRGLSLDEYKEKWGLPKDYPSVAPNYSAARSQMAKSLGLGQVRRSQAEPEVAPEPAYQAPPEPAPRGRRPKASAAQA